MRKGQSMTEYLVMLAAVLLVLILFLRRDGLFAKSYNAILDQHAVDISSRAKRIFF